MEMTQKELEAQIFPASPEGADLYKSLEGLETSLRLSKVLPKQAAVRLAAASLFFLSACAPAATPTREITETPTPIATPTEVVPTPSPTEIVEPTPTPTPEVEVAKIPEEIFPIYGTFYGYNEDRSAALMLTRLPQPQPNGVEYFVIFEPYTGQGTYGSKGDGYTFNVFEPEPEVYRQTPDTKRVQGTRPLPIIEIRAGEKEGELQAKLTQFTTSFEFTLIFQGTGKEEVYEGIKRSALEMLNSGPWPDGIIRDILRGHKIELP